MIPNNFNEKKKILNFLVKQLLYGEDNNCLRFNCYLISLLILFNILIYFHINFGAALSKLIYYCYLF